MAIDYFQIFLDLAERHSALIEQKKAIDVEIARLLPTIQSTYNLLSLAQQRKVAKSIDRIEVDKGLKNGVLMALKSRGGEWLTPPEIRDYLEGVGFNFGTSSDRGLASIGTTLRRMVPSELDTKARDNGQIAYGLKGFKRGDIAKAMRETIEEMRRAGSEVGNPLPIENTNEQRARGKK